MAITDQSKLVEQVRAAAQRAKTVQDAVTQASQAQAAINAALQSGGGAAAPAPAPSVAEVKR